ncbi:MAG: AMP-binding protein [Acidobacteriota bacterium]
MQTLLELLPEIRRLDGREAVRFYNGFRTWTWSYRDLSSRIAAFASYLNRQGFQKGDRLILWGENCPEWVCAFWAAVSQGIEVIPIDYRSSPRLVQRIQEEAQARLMVFGQAVETHEVDIEAIPFTELDSLEEAGQLNPVEVWPEDVVEIVYTSGTTGNPKGVVHRHKNICANLTPFKREIDRYKRVAWPFQPIRILEMLPLSHMFGQSLGLFIPPVLGGAAVFMTELNAGAVMEAIRRERVSVMVSVPRLLKSLSESVRRRFDTPENPPSGKGILNIALRWWRYRRVHRALGWKFWAFTVGGARLEPEIEDFWSRLGFLVIQGYGLTETSPVVSVNHPFRSRRGSLGKVLEGQEVEIAEDGEILVRGDSVVMEYLGVRPEEQEEAFEGGWFHTGDIGEIDEEGRLYYKGRKKDVIVTSEGLNVHPQDVEAALNDLPEVKESAVIGFFKNGEEQVHAVLILKDPAADAGELVRKANQRLESHQRIRDWSIWPEEDFPRTSSTLKVKRREVAQRISSDQPLRPDQPIRDETARGQPLEGILSRVSGKEASEIKNDTRLTEDLGLSSLDRVDLLARLEDRYGVGLEEAAFAEISTVGQLREWIGQADGRPAVEKAAPEGEEPARDAKPVRPPRWSRSLPIRGLRRAAMRGFILPLFGHYMDFRVQGLQHLQAVSPPLIFAANHESHLDTVAVYNGLPSRWRKRLAPAMMPEFFRAYFKPERFSWRETLVAGLQYYLAVSLFNTYPLARELGGVRQSLQYTGELIERGYCPLVFPEGERSPGGKMMSFKSGIGLMAARLRVPVVPIRLDGLFEVYSIHHNWPEAGPVRMSIGKPLRFEGRQDYREIAREIETAVRNLDG